MALFKNVTLSKDMLAGANPYLDDAEKGLELLKKIMASSGAKTNSDASSDIIRSAVIPLVAKATLDGETSIIREINNRLSEALLPAGISLRANKAVIGIGGRFSAGKSCFINSLIDAKEHILPENQQPTTSISTYIINGTERANTVLTANGSNISVDDDAINALTHRFYEIYKIGFSKYIGNIVLKTPKFNYKNIALLDTPGYNKSDANKKQDASDREQARKQLENVDHIIWVVDSDSVIKNEDLEFLQMLNNQNPILVVMNKADKKMPEFIREIIDNSRESLQNGGINTYDVVGYNSQAGKEILSDGVIKTFLDNIDASGSTAATNKRSYLQICNDILDQLKTQLKLSKKTLKQYEAAIMNTSEFSCVETIINEYKQSIILKSELEDMCETIKNALKKIK